MAELSLSRGAVVKLALQRTLDKALEVQQPVIVRHVERSRRPRPSATPAEIVTALERQYLAAVSTSGAAVGGSAAIPGVGTAASWALTIAEFGTFLELSALYALALAHVHGMEIQDIERRRTLVLAIIIGGDGAKVVEKAAGRTAPYWGRLLTDAVPTPALRKANKVLGQWFITKYGTKKGIIVLGRAFPFGIGAAIGGVGNAAIGGMIVRSSRKAFGPAPATWLAPEDRSGWTS